MKDEDMLYPEAIKAQCDAAIRILEQDNLDIEKVQKHLQDFMIDDELVSEAYSALKLQISDYLTITSAMISANDLDIADMQTLKNTVGKEELIGAVINKNMRDASEDIRSNEEQASEYSRMAAATLLISCLRTFYLEMAAYYAARAMYARIRYGIWELKAKNFEAISNVTKNLFTQSVGLRDSAKLGMASITKSFQNGVYVVDMNAPWRTALSAENDKLLEQIKASYMKKNEEGELVYDWDKIEELLEKKADEVSEMEYLALIDMMSEMSNDELEVLLICSMEKSWLFGGAYCGNSEVLKEAATRYMIVAQSVATVTVFSRKSKYDYVGTDVINSLSKACFIQTIVNYSNLAGVENYNITISSTESGGEITYDAEITYTLKVYGNKADAPLPSLKTCKITVNPWGTNENVRDYMDKYEKEAFNSLMPFLGKVIVSNSGEFVAGIVFEQLGKKTVESIGKSLSTTMSVVGFIDDLEECQENAFIVGEGLQMIETRRVVDALGVQAGVVNVNDGNVSNVELFCCRYNPEELKIRVAAYNSAPGNENGTITVDELKASIAGDGEVLDKYVDWYLEKDGETAVTNYWSELEVIANEYCSQNPSTIYVPVRELNISQLQELINKKNMPSYEINIAVMKGQE